MFFDWLAREGWMIVTWWLLATAMGAAALPLCLRLLGALPDKGYTLARTAGILLTGFVFWLLNNFGMLRNESGSVFAAGLIVFSASLALYFQMTRPAAERHPFDWRGWLRENRWVIVTAEVLFIVLLVGWSAYRAYQNNLNGTEKPMDLAFLSSAMHSPTYPPNDPWLSGYAISYYYFGYVLGGIFGTTSGLPSTITYNLWMAMLFALTGLTTFGVVCNLVRSRYRPIPEITHANPTPIPSPQARRGAGDSDQTTSREPQGSVGASFPLSVYGEGVRGRGLLPGIITGLFGVILLLFASGYQTPLVDIPYQSRTATLEYLQFWDVNGRQQPLPPFPECPPTATCPPNVWYIDFFKAARTLNDRNLPSMVERGAAGEREEVINEFPMFSFVLADSHPHVMALPFTILAIGLAANVLLSARTPNREQILLYGLCIGGLVFLNTWDSPVYMLVLVSAEMLRRLLTTGRLVGDDWFDALILLFSLLAITFTAYLPFILSFSSQLGGLLPNIIWPTMIQQYFLAFGPLLPIVLLYLLVEAWRGIRSGGFHPGFGLATIVTFFVLLLVGMGIFIAIGAINPDARNAAQRFIDDAGGWSVFLPEVLAKRVSHIGTTLLLLFFIALVTSRLYIPLRKYKATNFEADIVGHGDDETNDAVAMVQFKAPYPAATGFALLLIGAAAALTLIPDYVYLRDNFTHRMNTVFKFYYIGWSLYAVAGAYGVYSMLADVRLPKPFIPVRLVLAGAVAVAVAYGLVYPIMAIEVRAITFGSRITLADGTEAVTLDAWDSVVTEDDYKALLCLQEKIRQEDDPNPIVLETGYGGSYDFNEVPGTPLASGRTSAMIGTPTVIGWAGHQSQWRGRGFSVAVGSRVEDVRMIYEDLRLDVVAPLLERYNVDFIFYGAAERGRYGSVGEQKFLDSFDIVCQENNSRIYRVRPVNLFAESN